MKNNAIYVIFAILCIALGVMVTMLLRPNAPVVPTLNTPPTITVATGPTVLNAIQSEAKLETVVMKLAKHTTVARIHGPMDVCSEQITYLGYFNVSAGVDLAQIKPSDVDVTDDGYPDKAKVTISLPSAEIMHTELDTKESGVIAQNSPQWIPGCTHQIADMTVDAQRRLRESVTTDALQGGILSMAEEKAAFELKRLLLDVGYKDVTVRYSHAGTNDPTQTAPAVEQKELSVAPSKTAVPPTANVLPDNTAKAPAQPAPVKKRKKPIVSAADAASAGKASTPPKVSATEKDSVTIPAIPYH